MHLFILRFAMALSLVWVLAEPVQAQWRTTPPVFNPNTRSFNGTLDVTVTCASRSYDVYYTTDNNTPNTDSEHETSPAEFEVTETTTIKALCRYTSFGIVYTSEVASATYTQQAVPIPKVSPAGGYHNPDPSTGKLAVKVSGESNATLHYTLDGGIPNEKSPTVTSGGTVQVTPTQTLNVIALRQGWAPSPVLSEVYYKKETVPKPTANPGKDTTFSSTTTVTLASIAGAAIYYTLDNTAPVVGKNLYGLPITLPMATTTLRAISTKADMNTSEELKVVYNYLPKAPKPQPVSIPGQFIDTVRVYFQNPGAGLEIRYTTNGLTPTAQSPLYQGGIFVDTTLVLTARTFPAALGATTAQYAPSDPAVFQLALTLGAPTADKYVNGDYYRYRDSLAIRVTSDNPKAQILYTLGGGVPAPKTGSVLSKSNPIIRIGDKDTTIIQAIAITLDTTLRSPVATWKYIKDPTPKMPAPQAKPPGRVFRDSLLVMLTANDRHAVIVYTLDGSEPDRSPNGGSINGFQADSGTLIVLKQATTLKLKSFSDSLQASVVSSETYLLQPEPPEVSLSPRPVVAGTPITLSTRTPNAKIFYSLEPGPLDIANANTYNKGDTIYIRESLTLQAMATLGTGSALQTSPVVSFAYTLIENQGQTSVTRDTLLIDNYKLMLAHHTSPLVRVVYDTLPPLIDGLQLQRPIRLQPAQNGDKVEVWVGSKEIQGQLLYLIVNGSAKVVSPNLPVVVQEAGLYAFGRDTLPPQITMLSHEVNTDDSTEVRLEVRDNILNPFYQFQSSGAQKWSEVRSLRGPLDTLKLRIKNANGLVEELWLRLRVGDYRRVISFPADTGTPLILPQGFGNVTTPSVMKLGQASYRWDLVGFPADPINPISTDKLTEDNPGVQFKAYHLNHFTEYELLEAKNPMVPGKGYWLAADQPKQSLRLTRVKTPASDSDGAFKIHLTKGWNLIANPTLRTLYWPSARDRADFDQLSVRGLVPYSHSLQGYSQSDSLEPFRGYFVYYRNPGDITVTLLRQPFGASQGVAAGVASKRMAQTLAAPRTWRIVLAEGQRVPVTLAAYDGAVDGLGAEDEGALPTPSNQPSQQSAQSSSQGGSEAMGFRLHARRSNRALMSDYVRFAEDGIKAYTVAFGSPHRPQPIPEIQVSDLRLPEGYQAWAWLPHRRLKQPLTQGASLRDWTSSSDSLVVLVGPTQALRQVAGFSLAQGKPEVRQIRIARPMGHKGQMRLEIDLPTDQRIRIEKFKANGQTQELLKSLDLGAGYHQFDWSPPRQGEWIRLRGHDLKNSESWSQIFR